MKIAEIRERAKAAPVSGPAGAVFLAMLLHCGKGRLIWPSQIELASVASVSPRTVRNAVRELEKQALIRRTGRRRGGATEYEILGDAPQIDADEPAQDATHTGRTCRLDQHDMPLAQETPGTTCRRDWHDVPPDVARRAYEEQGSARKGKETQTSSELLLFPTASEPPADVPPPADQGSSPAKILFSEARRILPALGVPDRQVGSLVGGWRKRFSAAGREESDLLDVLWAAERHQPSDPVAWIQGAIRRRLSEGAHGDRSAAPQPIYEFLQGVRVRVG